MYGSKSTIGMVEAQACCRQENTLERYERELSFAKERVEKLEKLVGLLKENSAISEVLTLIQNV